MSHRPAFFLAVLIVAAAAACERRPTPAATRPVEPSSAPEWQRCTNPEHGFSVSFPDDWQTNSGEVMPECSAFDPEAIEIPPASEIPFEIAIVIGVEPVQYEELTAPSRWERIHTTERVQVDGRRGRRIEAEATGEGLASAGLRSTRFVVDLGEGRSLIATTHQTGPDYRRDQEILARMMETITIPAEGEIDADVETSPEP
jgi:hypothetical protein